MNRYLWEVKTKSPTRGSPTGVVPPIPCGQGQTATLVNHVVGTTNPARSWFSGHDMQSPPVTSSRCECPVRLYNTGIQNFRVTRKIVGLIASREEYVSGISNLTEPVVECSSLLQRLNAIKSSFETFIFRAWAVMPRLEDLRIP